MKTQPFHLTQLAFAVCALAIPLPARAAVDIPIADFEGPDYGQWNQK